MMPVLEQAWSQSETLAWSIFYYGLVGLCLCVRYAVVLLAIRLVVGFLSGLFGARRKTPIVPNCQFHRASRYIGKI